MNELHSEQKLKTVINAVLLIIAVFLAFVFAEQYREMYPILVEAERMELIQQNFERNISALSNTSWKSSSSYKPTAYSSNSHSNSSISVNSYQNEVYSSSVFENAEYPARQLLIGDAALNKGVISRKTNRSRTDNSFQIKVPTLKMHRSVSVINQYVAEEVLAVETEISGMQRPFSARAEDDPGFPGDPGELPLTNDAILLFVFAGIYGLIIHFKLKAK
ncbi:MAG: hypothetical protein ACOYM7_03510 [Paludibacter sp.]